MQLIDDVIQASRDNAALNPRNWTIVDIGDVRSDNIGIDSYECRGIAKLSGGESVPVQFGVTDTHGNQAPLYSFQTD